MNTNASWPALVARAPARVPAQAGVRTGDAMDSVLCALFVAYLGSILVEGVVRYALATAGMPDLLYVRDAIPVASVAFLFLRTLLGQDRVDLAIAIPAALLACHAAYAAMLGVAFFSIAFALKIFMFIVYGMAMWPLLARRFHIGLTVASVMFAIAAAGVFANHFFGTMPWEGLTYDTAFGRSSTTRVWWMGDGIARLPGFARTSFSAAMILGITGLLAMIRFPRPLARLAIAAAAITATVLTTSKGMVLAIPVAALWLFLQDRWPRLDGHLLVGVLCAAALALPALVVAFDLQSTLRSSDFPGLIGSVWDRFATTWPRAVDLLPDGPAALLGGGPGSIGTPQNRGYDAHHLNAGDSIAVYMMVSFGVAGLCYAAFPAFMVRKVLAANPADVRRAYVALLVITYVYGFSINMVEEPFFSMFFGLCLGAGWSAWLGRTERRR